VSPVNPDDFDEIVARINKKYEGDLRNGNMYEHPDRLSSRSLALDVAMGGGLPQGRISRLYGPYSSTKSLTGWNLIAEAQDEGLSCCYWNIEKSYDPEFVEQNMGVDIDNLLIMEGTTIEEIGEKLESLLGAVHLHVIDSCSQAVSQDELDAEVNAWRPGLGARAWGKVFRRINDRFDHFENTIVLLDQVRDNFKTGAQEPPGGRMLDHASSMSVKFKKGPWLFRNADGVLDEKAKKQKDMMSDQLEPAGIEIRARVEKSRVCRPLIPATMRLDLDTVQFDRVFEYVEAAKAYNVVESRGGGNFYYPAVAKKGQKQHHLRSGAALREFIAGDLTLQREIRKKAIAAARMR
jgi:RecA/RadA recombinase